MNLWKERNFTPMLLSEVKKPFNDKDYIYEMKFDGYRALVFASKSEIKIKSRNNKDITALYPGLQNIKKIVKGNVIFDGEIIAEENGVPSFKKLQKISQKKVKSKNDPVVFMAFDILYEGKNLTNQPLMKRKELLEKYPNTFEFVKAKYIEEKGMELFEVVKDKQLEGIVAKKKNGKYHLNSRTDDFIKIKNILREEFYIIGYQENKNNSISLLLGQEKNEYVGKVIVSKKKEISRKVLALKKVKIIDNKVLVTPKYKAIVDYLERTDAMRLRHPIFIDYE